MKFTMTLVFLATILTAVVATAMDKNANCTTAMSSVFVDAMTISTTASITAINVSPISSSLAEDVVTVHVTTSTTVPCTDGTESAANSTTTVTTHVFKTTTDLITVTRNTSFSSTVSVQMPGSVVTSMSTLIPNDTVSISTTSALTSVSFSASISDSALSPLSKSRISTIAVNTPSAASISTQGQSAVTTPSTKTAVDAMRVFTSASPSSVVVFKATTAVPVQYLSTIVSDSSTMTVTMTSTSTSTRIISVMMNGGYISALPFLPYQSNTAGQSMITGQLSSIPTHSQSQSTVQPHVAIATSSQSETCTPLTVYITVTGSIAGTSTVLAPANSAGHGNTMVGGEVGSRSTFSSMTAITPTAPSTAVYGALSTTSGSTSSNSAAKPSTTATITSISGTGSSNSSQTTPSTSPFLTPNSGNNNGTATSNAGKVANRMPSTNTVLAVLLMAVSAIFVLAL